MSHFLISQFRTEHSAWQTVSLTFHFLQVICVPSPIPHFTNRHMQIVRTLQKTIFDMNRCI